MKRTQLFSITGLLALLVANSGCLLAKGAAGGATGVHAKDRHVHVDMLPWIHDTDKSELHNPDDPEAPHASAHLATVQIVNASKGEVECDEYTFRFRHAYMADLRLHSGHPQRLCGCLWEDFRPEPLLEGRSGVLLKDGTVLSSGHGRLNCDETYVIIGRTRAFQAVDGWLEIPASHVRKVAAVIDCEDSSQADWVRFSLHGDLEEEPWTHRVSLGAEVEPGDEVFVTAHPLGLPVKYSDLAVVRVNEDEWHSINIDHAPGSSGAPVFTSQGKVVGVVTGSQPRYSWAKAMFQLWLSAPEMGCIGPRPYWAQKFTPVQDIRRTPTQDSPSDLKACPWPKI